MIVTLPWFLKNLAKCCWKCEHNLLRLLLKGQTFLYSWYFTIVPFVKERKKRNEILGLNHASYFNLKLFYVLVKKYLQISQWSRCMKIDKKGLMNWTLQIRKISENFWFLGLRKIPRNSNWFWILGLKMNFRKFKLISILYKWDFFSHFQTVWKKNCQIKG